MRIFTVIIALLLLLSCTGNKEKNIFSDETVRQIYGFQDVRDTENLSPFLKNSRPEYRKFAALAFASIQDKEAVDELILLLGDEDESVRTAAAYALGQTADKGAEPGLIKCFRAERSELVKIAVLEAMGKCGGEKSQELLSDPSLSRGNDLILKGQALGIYRLALRKKHSAKSLQTVINVLLKSDSADVRFYASNTISRIRDVDLTKYFVDIRDLIGEEKEESVKMHLISALGKCKGAKVADLLRELLKREKDQRVIVNIIRALGKFEYKDVRDDLLSLVLSREYQISVTASEVLLNTGSSEDISAYLDIAKRTSNWRTGANLFRLSLRLTRKKGAVSSLITGYYKKSIDPYQKGALLIALSEYPKAYPFVESETFKNNHKIVTTSGMISISEMLSNKGFDPEKIVSGGKGSNTLRKIFADIFKRGIVSGDSSLIAVSSSALRDPRHKFIKVITDLTFMEEELSNYKLPADIDKKREIKKILDYFRGIKAEAGGNSEQQKPLDWKRIVKIPVEQKVKIVTDEGDIVIELFVNDSPGSVSNFLDMISEGYLGSGAFHRVVPNFVIQDGCPRGDGWGGPERTIRSEFSHLYYEEGSVGMASSGKDTEGSQWFITHSSTPHLDGRYTIFGKVISGMEVVQKIQVGTRISGYNIL